MYSHNWEMNQGKLELVFYATQQFDEFTSKKDIE
jgi:hypothetical protein